MAFCGFLWVLEMNAIALALTGLNPPQPDQRRLRRHHGAAGHFGGETFLLKSQTAWTAEGVLLG